MSEPSNRRTRPAVMAAAVGALGALLSLGLIPATLVEVGPAVMSAKSRLGEGSTILMVPPLGTVSARTHPAPIDLEIGFPNVNIEELAGLATSEAGREELRGRVKADLRSLAVRTGVRTVVGAALIGAICAMLVFHRRWWLVGVGAMAGAVTAGVLLAVTVSSYDLDAFAEPRFEGQIRKARVVIDAIQEGAGILEEARTRYETASRRVSELMVLLAEPNADPRGDTMTFLHVGDLHANPIGLEIVQEIARDFEVDYVIDTGDLASSTLDTGEISSLTEPVDRALMRSVERVPARYLFVPGNHDSPQLLRALGRAGNVTVLDERAVDLGVLDVLGWPDPTFSEEPVPEDDKALARLEEAPAVAAAVASERPDILAVHDERLASESIGDVPVVLAGHTHERALEDIDGTVVLTVGSTGATGLKSLTVEADRSYEAELLYFRGSRLVAVDYVTFEGLGADFVLERTTIRPEE